MGIGVVAAARDRTMWNMLAYSPDKTQSNQAPLVYPLRSHLPPRPSRAASLPPSLQPFLPPSLPLPSPLPLPPHPPFSGSPSAFPSFCMDQFISLSICPPTYLHTYIPSSLPPFQARLRNDSPIPPHFRTFGCKRAHMPPVSPPQKAAAQCR